MKVPGRKLVIQAAAVSALILGLLFWRLADFGTVADVLGGYEWHDFLWAGLLYILAPLGRTLRFVFLLDVPMAKVHRLFWAVSLHQLAVRLMPVRTGEAVFPYLYHKTLKMELGEGVAGLIYSRLLDLASMAAAFLVALWLTGSSVPFAWPLWAATMLAVLLCFALLMPRLLAWTGRLSSRFGVKVHRAAWLFDAAASLGEQSGKAASKILRPLRLAMAAFATLIVWLGVFGCFWALMRPFSLSLSQVVLGGTAASVAGSLPVGGIGNFGPQEAGWTLGFTSVGLDAATALTTGMLANLFTLAATASIASVCSLFGLVGASSR